MRKELSDIIKKQIDLWRIGLIGIPNSYIEFHKDLADKEIQNLKDNGFTIHKKWLCSDGWME